MLLNHPESICYYGQYAPLPFFPTICKSMFSLFSVLAVVSELYSTKKKIKNKKDVIIEVVFNCVPLMCSKGQKIKSASDRRRRFLSLYESFDTDYSNLPEYDRT